MLISFDATHLSICSINCHGFYLGAITSIAPVNEVSSDVDCYTIGGIDVGLHYNLPLAAVHVESLDLLHLLTPVGDKHVPK